MSVINNQIKPELLTDYGVGQTQSARKLATQYFRYFSAEERSLTHWFSYIRKFSYRISFIEGPGGNNLGNWETAIPDEYQVQCLQDMLDGKSTSPDIIELSKRPDISVFLAFFTMMQYPLEQFYRFTKRDRDHYYREILGCKQKAPVPDRGHLVLTLDDTLSSLTLRKGTKFTAGNDAAGKPIYYENHSNSLITLAQVEKLHTLSRRKEDNRLLLRKCIDVDAKLEMPEDGVLTFGESSFF